MFQEGLHPVGCLPAVDGDLPQDLQPQITPQIAMAMMSSNWWRRRRCRRGSVRLAKWCVIDSVGSEGWDMVLLRDSGEIRENHSPVACRNQPVGERWLGRKRFGPGTAADRSGLKGMVVACR